MAKSRLDSQGEFFPLRASPKQTRLEFMRNRLLGIVFWQKDTQDPSLKPIIDEFIVFKKSEIDNYSPEEKNKLALEAELFFSGAVSLKEEFLKNKKEAEKKEIKAELESITGKIKRTGNGKKAPKTAMNQNLNNIWTIFISLLKIKFMAKKIKKTTKSVKPAVKTGKLARRRGGSKKAEEIKVKIDNLLKKGKARGFVTYSEIIKEFPHIEEDVALFGRHLRHLQRIKR